MPLRLLAAALLFALLPAGSVTLPVASGDAQAPPAGAPVVLDLAMSKGTTAGVGNAVRCEIGPARPAAAAQDRPAARADAARHGAHAPPAPVRAASRPAAAPHDHAAPASQAVVHGSHASGGCQPTPEQEAAAAKLVQDVRAILLDRFDLPEKAFLAGYHRGPNESQENIHYFNPDEQQSPTVLDPRHPEGVVYRERQVIGAVFMMPARGQKGPQPGGCLMQWHQHFDERAGNVSPEAIHVWIVDRPGGPFGH